MTVNPMYLKAPVCSRANKALLLTVIFFSMPLLNSLKASTEKLTVIEETMLLEEKVAEKQAPAEAHFRLAWLYQRQGFSDKAAQQYRESIRKKPGLISAHINLANILGRNGRFKEAEKVYKDAIRLKPESVEAHYNRGALYLKMQEYNKALYSFYRTIRLNPAHKGAHLNLATVYMQYYRRGHSHEHYRMARDHLIKASKIDKKYAHVYYNLGALYELAGKNGFAIQYYRESLRYYNENSPFRKKARKRIRYLTDLIK